MRTVTEEREGTMVERLLAVRPSNWTVLLFVLLLSSMQASLLQVQDLPLTVMTLPGHAVVWLAGLF
jgi:hypothetical protein